jgi:hypothetical protein
MRPQKFTPRADYRQEEALRTAASVSLSEKFRELKSLTVEFGYFSPEGVTRNSQIKYTVNPQHARSVFRLDCFNTECIRGDFDLSEVLAQAVAARQSVVTGELRCQGWLSKTTIDRIRCDNILRYKLSLEYGTRAAVRVNGASAADLDR